MTSSPEPQTEHSLSTFCTSTEKSQGSSLKRIIPLTLILEVQWVLEQSCVLSHHDDIALHLHIVAFRHADFNSFYGLK